MRKFYPNFLFIILPTVIFCLWLRPLSHAGEILTKDSYKDSCNTDCEGVISAMHTAHQRQVAGYFPCLGYNRLTWVKYLRPDAHFRWSATQIIQQNRAMTQPMCTPVRFVPDIETISITD